MSEAEIHALPTIGLSTSQVSRIVTEMVEAQAAGCDLGSRVPHIQANSDALLTPRRDLERELAGLQSALEQLGVWDRQAGPPPDRRTARISRCSAPGACSVRRSRRAPRTPTGHTPSD